MGGEVGVDIVVVYYVVVGDDWCEWVVVFGLVYCVCSVGLV